MISENFGLDKENHSWQQSADSRYGPEGPIKQLNQALMEGCCFFGFFFPTSGIEKLAHGSIIPLEVHRAVEQQVGCLVVWRQALPPCRQLVMSQVCYCEGVLSQ